ncbi:sensor histidine kinase [Phytoactinopolyspora mesophila]|uniref:histidine kinase n=1 Tax=Phytoactinopolyspora mesophila TaxID=2650750 RepID=A0A7K3M938_9ACTN|nr:ATP-binding protein [Phytoactinopolyspora mesophila]NDL59861.1 two-component sensor histidine kinase [Phytoactinopolyspora mesophila]
MIRSGAGAHRRIRSAGCTVLVIALLGWGVAVPWARPLATTTAVVAILMIWWPRSKSWLPWLPWLVGGAGVVSGVATLGHRVLDWPGMPPLAVAETALLCVLVGVVVRWATVRAAVVAGCLAGLAASVSVLRATGYSDADQLTVEESVYAVAFWALGPILAAAVGLYLRHLDHRRARAVAAARQAQRLELAHDLHDYVAHDVSEMIAQAQAAQVITDDGHPVQVVLRRIEAAGLRAMTSMDSTVHLLRGDGNASDRQVGVSGASPGLAELPELVERFGSAGAADVRLCLDPDLVARVPRELAGTVHRVVVEALTNVRRHAPSATTVRIVIREDGDELEVLVSNDAGGAPIPDLGRRGGVGLPGLAERVEALSGTFRAGPDGQGWRVSARLPLVATYSAGPEGGR